MWPALAITKCICFQVRNLYVLGAIETDKKNNRASPETVCTGISAWPPLLAAWIINQTVWIHLNSGLLMLATISSPELWQFLGLLHPAWLIPACRSYCLFYFCCHFFCCSFTRVLLCPWTTWVWVGAAASGKEWGQPCDPKQVLYALWIVLASLPWAKNKAKRKKSLHQVFITVTFNFCFSILLQCAIHYRFCRPLCASWSVFPPSE